MTAPDLEVVGPEPETETETDPEIMGPKGGELGAAFLGRAKAYFNIDNMIPVEVPELGGRGLPSRVWVTPVAPKQRDTAEAQSTHKGKAHASEFAARIVIMKARDIDGNLLFKNGDLPDLLRLFPAAVLERIAKAALGDFGEAPEEDELVKPSPPTGTS